MNQPEVKQPETPTQTGDINIMEMLISMREENRKNMESLKEDSRSLNQKIDETNRKMEDGQKTEELLEKNIEIIKENLSEELGVKIGEDIENPYLKVNNNNDTMEVNDQADPGNNKR